MEKEEIVERFKVLFGIAHSKNKLVEYLSEDCLFGLMDERSFRPERYTRYGWISFRRQVLRHCGEKLLPLTKDRAVRLRYLYYITKFFGTSRLNMGVYEWKVGDTGEVLCIVQKGVILLHSLVGGWNKKDEVGEEVFKTEESRRRWRRVKLLITL